MKDKLSLLFSALSLFLIHLFAYPCGSIIRGHFRLFSMMRPFSLEKESTGSPLICHLLIYIDSPRTYSREKFSKVLSVSANI